MSMARERTKTRAEHQPIVPKIFRGRTKRYVRPCLYLQHCDSWPKPLRHVQNAKEDEMLGANNPYDEATMQATEREQAVSKSSETKAECFWDARS